MNIKQFSIKAIIGLLGLATIFLTANMTFAQGDFKAQKGIEDMPKRIFKSNFQKDIKGDNRESFYVFEVGPGETVLKIKMKADRDNAGANIYFKDKNDEEIIPFVLVQDSVIEGENVETVKINTKKTMLVYMQISEIQYGSRASYPGTLQIDFSGAFVSWEKK